MIKQTLLDLVPFLTFFYIMIGVFTFILGTLSFENYVNREGGDGPH